MNRLNEFQRAADEAEALTRPLLYQASLSSIAIFLGKIAQPILNADISAAQYIQRTAWSRGLWELTNLFVAQGARSYEEVKVRYIENASLKISQRRGEPVLSLSAEVKNEKVCLVANDEVLVAMKPGQIAFTSDQVEEIYKHVRSKIKPFLPNPKSLPGRPPARTNFPLHVLFR